MYNEEVDLSLRLRRVGWETHYAPVGAVVHVGGASTSQQRAAMVEQYVRSTGMLYARNFSRLQRAELRAILTGVLTARSLRDHLRLVVTRSDVRRDELQAQLAGWRSARALLRHV